MAYRVDAAFVSFQRNAAQLKTGVRRGRWRCSWGPRAAGTLP